MIKLLMKTHDLTKHDKFVNKTHDFIKHDEFANEKWKGVISGEKKRNKKDKCALLIRTCPPGLALAGPDMSEVRLLFQFRTFRVQN